MEQIELIKRLVSSAKRQSKRKKSAMVATAVPGNGEVKVVTTVKAKKKDPRCFKTGPTSYSSSSGSGSSVGSSRVELDSGRRPHPQESLAVLKGMKKLQNTLQRDDLNWT